MDSIIITALLSVLFLLVGFILGWLGNERYTALMCMEEHDYDELFEKNPHPELFDDEGRLFKGEYINLKFDLGYNPDEFNPEDIVGEG